MIKITTMFFVCLLLVHPVFAGGLEGYEHKKPIKTKNITLFDDQRTIHNLNDFRGKVVLLNFWASWCVPCVREMPSFSSLQESIEGRDIVILPVSIDYKGIEAVNEFYKKHEITNLPSYLDEKGKAFRSMELKALPTTLIINKLGMEVARVLGEIDWSDKEVKEYLYKMSRE